MYKVKRFNKIDKDGSIGASAISTGAALTGLGAGLGITGRMDKKGREKIAKEVEEELAKKLSNESDKYNKGVETLKRIAKEKGTDITKDKTAQDVLSRMNKMKDRAVELSKIESKSALESKLKDHSVKMSKKYLRNPLIGLAVTSAAAAPIAYKYMEKQRKENNLPEYKMTDLDAAAIGGSLGLAARTIQNAGSKSLKGSLKKDLVIPVAVGSTLGLGAKKVYDNYKKKDKTE